MNRFWARIDVAGPDDCWEWQEGGDKDGYGLYRIPGGGKVRAHRYAFELGSGQTISPGMWVLHSCDNPPCCNPAHLSEGTPRANYDDMVRKGRRGRIPTKLTAAQAAEIRFRWSSGERQVDLAAAFNVSQPAISCICRGRTWVAA